MTHNAVEKVWTQAEINRKTQLEQVIDRSHAQFIEVGLAVAEIRQGKLYQIEYETFEEYCDKHWGWTKQRIYQIMDATEIHRSLPPKVNNLLTRESQLRPLKSVPPVQREIVVREASKASPNGHVTAKAITEAAQRVVTPKPTPTEKPQLLDATGFPVPDSVIQLFHRVEEVKEVLSRFASTRGLMRRVEETKDMLWQPVNKSTMMADLDRIYHELKTALPYAVCPYCQGREETKSHCTACKKRGVVSEFFWKTAVDPELKAVREKSCKR
jgi:hypothetical protein